MTRREKHLFSGTTWHTASGLVTLAPSLWDTRVCSINRSLSRCSTACSASSSSLASAKLRTSPTASCTAEIGNNGMRREKKRHQKLKSSPATTPKTRRNGPARCDRQLPAPCNPRHPWLLAKVDQVQGWLKVRAYAELLGEPRKPESLRFHHKIIVYSS